MHRLLAIVSASLLVATAVQAAPPMRDAAPPDFWYVVPDETSASGASGLVRGIVVPSSATPTVQTTPAGSVISWRRPDGTQQSFVVQGISSFTFEPGPLAGTTYVPFGRRKHLQYAPDSCCTCASWQNSVESVEALSCVPGCIGCGCEGCICSPTYPCPEAAIAGMTLVAHNGPGPTMTFGRSGANDGITIVRKGRAAVRFHGKHLAANVTSQGETEINNPDSITLPGRVATRASIRGDKALFAWSSSDASVILEQPQSMPAPSFQGGTIDFDAQPADAPTTTAKRLEVEPVMDRCRVCGTHPNSTADLDIYDCVSGDSVCYRCVSWECFAPAS